MKKVATALVFVLIMFMIWFYYHNFSFRKYTKLNEAEALACIESSLKDSIPANLKFITIVKDEQTAIAIAEPILFSIYGTSKILMERPYKICLVGKYWVIIGTFPRISDFLGASGGTFEIIINSETGEVKSITHGK